MRKSWTDKATFQVRLSQTVIEKKVCTGRVCAVNGFGILRSMGKTVFPGLKQFALG